MKQSFLRPSTVVIAIAQVSLSSGLAWANCATNGDVITCTGDVDPYANTSVPDSTTYSDYYTFTFKNLTSDLTDSSTSTTGIEVKSEGVEGDNHTDDSTGGHSMVVNWSGGFYKLDVSGNPVVMSTTGGKGHSGNSNGSPTSTSSHSGGTGVTGGAGGFLTLNWDVGDMYGEVVKLTSTGGDGGEGGEGQSDTGSGKGGKGGRGAAGGALNLNFGENGFVDTYVSGFDMVGTGGDGGYGGEGYSTSSEAEGGDGGQGGTGSNINVNLKNSIKSRPAASGDAVHFNLQSLGGDGGHGGNAHGSVTESVAGDGGLGGYGGTIKFDGSEGWLDLKNDFGTPAILAVSEAGRGGHGGNGSSGGKGKGGDGGEGGTGGDVTIDLSSQYTSIKNQATDPSAASNQGVLAQSIGGSGGNGGNGSGGLGGGKAGGGGGGGNAGKVTVSLGGLIETNVDASEGILAQSVAGLAGASGYSTGFAAYAATSQSGGSSSGVEVTTLSTATLSTTGDYSAGIHGQSIGGGGGRGSNASGIVALGGDGSAGGDGGTATVTNGGAITTAGDYSDGISLQSIGGSGGAGGASNGLTAIGGDAGSGGDGGKVNVSVLGSIATEGSYSDGVLAQSIGGGGGKAHSTKGLVAIGGTAGDGGDGGAVTMELGGTIETQGDFSDAFHVQSIGGGGGKGSNAISAGVEFSTAVGGNGGSGGNAGAITISDSGTAGSITTTGISSSGLVVQSVGGGGGNGGYAISASAGIGIDASVGSGGNGESGGNGGDVTVSDTIASSITTDGDMSYGIQVQSVGGGGGNGGMAISSANTNGLAMSAAVGGKGGGGGDGGAVDLTLSSRLDTEGDGSTGVIAQSIGGGGGTSGMTIDANAVSNYSLSASVGRSGGGGGSASDVTVHSTGGYVSTYGDSAGGIFAQSIGGNGGNAGMVVAASGLTSSTAVDLAIGGSGGAGGSAGDVTVTVEEASAVTTYGDNAIAINAHSVGGGGGHGAMTVAGSLESSGAINMSIGGAGGGGGDGGDVAVNNYSYMYTVGANSIGILAKSVGGSGGAGGMSIAGDGMSSGAATVSVSGNGGGGHESGAVTVDSSAYLYTNGIYATGIKAMSIGGGGGNATAAISGTTSSMGQASVTVGGEGGGGGTAGAVSVTRTDELQTSGDYADAIVAMSLGGSGGHGAFSAAGSLTAGEYSGATGVTLGGAGGGGGKAGTVTVTTNRALSNNKIKTTGYQSRGIIATSIGGNGGMGGSAYSGALNFSTEGSMQANVTVGGFGGTGGESKDVQVTNGQLITTSGHYSDGILASSVGGDGGIGGNAVAASITATDSSSANFETAVGGYGGDGSTAGDVTISNTATIETQGVESSGIYAQSIGGGGGRAGNAGTLVFDYTSSQQGNSDTTVAMNVSMAIGGVGGSGHHSGTVTVENSGDITAGYEEFDDEGNQISDRMAYGIFAQSIGGGGGDGGSSSAFNMSVNGACTFNQVYLPSEISCDTGGDDATASPKTTYAPSMSLSVGGNGGAAGDGDDVSVTNDGTVTTSGTGSYGIYAQSTGGGGGTGGGGTMGLDYVLPDQQTNSVLGYIQSATSTLYSNSRSFQSVSLSVGGWGGASGHAGAVTVTNTGAVTTSGFTADAIQALSTGGGGGNGGTVYTGLGSPGIDTFAVGGLGSGGGNGGHITVDSAGTVTTTGIDAMGIFAQSVGGGGGRAGAVSRALVGTMGVDMNVGFAIGGTLSAGDGGNGGKVDVTVGAGGLTTTGIRSHGVWAQSVGGGGGASSWGGGLEDAENEAVSFAGGGGDYGAGGDVSVTVDGALSVSGISAVGVFGQSVSGADAVTTDGGQTAGSVTATINGSVSATGDEGRAIFLQSQGLEGNGKIYVNVADGASVTASSGTRQAILLSSGNSKNSIDNYGTIQRSETDETFDGYALKTHDGAVTVHNYGYWEGSVSLAGAKDNGASVSNLFYNDATSAYTGRLAMGSEFDLGSSTASALVNNGEMTAGTFGAVGDTTTDSIATTYFTGALAQNDGAVYWVDHDFSGNNDEIFVYNANIEFYGEVHANPVGDVPSDGASGSFPVLARIPASSTPEIDVIIDDSTFTEDTAIVDYSLSTDTEGTLFVNYDVNYAAWETAPQTSYVNADDAVVAAPTPDNVDNLNMVVAYIDDLVALRNTAAAKNSTGFAEFDAFIAPLLSLEEVDDVVEIYQHFSNADLMRLADASAHSAYRFADALMSCPDQNDSGQILFQNEGSCAWFSFGGLTRNTNGTDGGVSYDENTWVLSGGAQVEFQDGWFLGGALSYESVSSSTSISSGSGDRYHAGAVLKRALGPNTFALSVSGGVGEYDIRRNPLEAYNIQPGDAEAPQNAWAGIHGRYSTKMSGQNGWFFEPMLDVGATWVHQDSTAIDGSLPFDIDMGAMDTVKFTVNPMLEIGKQIKTSGGPLNMRFGVGYLGVFGEDFSSQISASDVGGGTETFTSVGGFDEHYLDVMAELSGQIGKRTSIKLSVGGLLSDNDRTFGGNLRLSYQF